MTTGAEARLSVLVQVNAGQATPALAAVETGLKGIAAAGAQVAREVQPAVKPITQVGTAGAAALTQVEKAAQAVTGANAGARRSFDEIRAAVDSSFAASQKYQAVQIEIAAAVERGEVSQSTANIALEQAAKLYMGVATASERAMAAERDRQAATASARQGYQLLRASVDSVWATSMRYEAAVETLNAAQRAGVITDRDRERTLALLEAQMIDTTQAAGGLGRAGMQNSLQLGYQANDVLMMASLGQSPFALMMQQGPQVVQVLNEMRASGQAIGPAIVGSLGMIMNPMALATMAIIGGAAALVQWGMSAIGAGEDTVSFDAAIGDLGSSIRQLETYMDLVGAPAEELAEKFGLNAERARELYEVLVRLQTMRVAADVSTAVSAAGEELGAFFDEMRRVESFRGEPRLMEHRVEIGPMSDWGLDLAAAEEIKRAYDDMASAATWQEQAAAAQALAERIAEVRDSSGKLPPMFRDAAIALNEAAVQALQFGALTDDAATESERLAAAEEARGRNTAELRWAVAAEREDRRAAAEAALDAARAARDQADEIRGQVALQAAIAQFGADSAQVAGIRAAQELAAFRTMVDSLNISGQLKEELYNAKMEALGLANSGLPAMLSSAAGATAGIWANLSGAAGAAWDMAAGVAAAAMDTASGAYWREQNRALGDDERGTQGEVAADARDYNTDQGIQRAQDRLRAQLAARNPTGSGGPSGGGSAAAETSAVQDLIQSLQDEIAIAREMDPVQQELLRNREALAGASEAERDQVEELIRTRNAEAEALERVQSQMADVRDLGQDMLSGMISDLRDGADGWDILANALGRFADKLIDLGTDSLADVLFGTGQQGGGSGLLGSLLQGILFPSFGGIGMGASGKVASVTKHALGAVYDQPLYFSMGAAGRLGVMAEAGAEAIMPLTHAMGGGVGARLGGEEMTLPLTRLASGKLGVDLSRLSSPFALGDAFGDIAAVSAPASWRQAGGTASAPATSAPAVGDININLDLRGATVTEDLLPQIEARVQAAVKQAVNADNRAFKAATKAVLADKRAR